MMFLSVTLNVVIECDGKNNHLSGLDNHSMYFVIDQELCFLIHIHIVTLCSICHRACLTPALSSLCQSMRSMSRETKRATALAPPST